MCNGLGGLLLQPAHDGNSVIAVHHKRVMRVMDGAGQFHFENLIKRFNCLCCGFLVHSSSCYSTNSDAKTQRHKDDSLPSVGAVCDRPGGHRPPLQTKRVSSVCLCVFYCAFEVTVFPIGEWSGIAETPSS